VLACLPAHAAGLNPRIPVGVCTLFALYPVLWVLSVALSGTGIASHGGVLPVPHEPTLDNFRAVVGADEAAAEILKVNPQIKILVLSMHSNENYVRKAFEVGAKG